MIIKAIRSERDYRRTLRTIERLWGARAGTPEAEALDVLTTLAEVWEERHHAILPPDPVAAIRFRMEQEGLGNDDLAKILGGRNRVSEVLRGKRGLSLEMIRNLHRKLRIPAETLLAVR